TLPGGIHIQVSSPRAQGGDHLDGVVEEVTIPVFALAQRLFGALGGGEIHADAHQSGNLALRGPDGAEIDHGGKAAAVFAAILHFDAADPAGGGVGDVVD